MLQVFASSVNDELLLNSKESRVLTQYPTKGNPVLSWLLQLRDYHMQSVSSEIEASKLSDAVLVSPRYYYRFSYSYTA